MPFWARSRWRDIGMHFPDTDPARNGASSAHPRTCREAGRGKGLSCREGGEHRGLGTAQAQDYRIAIRENLAKILNLELDAVSVKFKTSEKVGPVGEGNPPKRRPQCFSNASIANRKIFFDHLEREFAPYSVQALFVVLGHVTISVCSSNFQGDLCYSE